MLKGNSNISYEFMCITIVDSAMGMKEIGKIPIGVSLDKIGTTDAVFDKMCAKIS